MSGAFRELLRKIGSGPHTGENLTRSQAQQAMQMMLCQEATPAQIGAFLIAHRIRRPTGEELAGMLDAYEEFGPTLRSIATSHPVTILGCPYDGRSRTLPVTPLIALVLAAADCPVILHGGDRMPTKYGIPLMEIWQGLGIDWTQASLPQVQTILETTGIGFIHLRSHFPQAHTLVQYRDEIGKRPPLATMELIWSPYAGDGHVVGGYVHPPTEGMFREALTLRGVTHFTTIKGLEGSCDLPRERTGIIGLSNPDRQFERLHLHPHDYDFGGGNVAMTEESDPIAQLQGILQGEINEARRSLLWNGGFYLWRCGACDSIASGINQTQTFLDKGLIQKKLKDLQQAVEKRS